MIESKDSMPAQSIDWAAVVAEHGATVIERLRAGGLSKEEAHEAAQAAWVRLYERYRYTCRRRLKLPGIVIVIARNLYIDAHRRRARPLDAYAVLRVDVDRPDRIVERRRLLRKVDQRLSQIGGREQAIFVGVVIEGRPIREVARQHGIGRTQAYSTVARVRAQLERIEGHKVYP